MAVTSGLVQRLTLLDGGPTLCVWLGPTETSSTLFFISVSTADSEADILHKRTMIKLLVNAQMTGVVTDVGHETGESEITSIGFPAVDISPVGQPIHGDFFSITGTRIPDDVEVVFDTGTLEIVVTPDLVRPHWVLISELPAAVPAGRSQVRLESPTWTSDAVPVDVESGPRTTVRVLYSGAPKTRPYAFLLVANPGIETEAGGTYVADSVLTDRSGFHDAARYCLQSCLLEREDVLRRDDNDAHIRFVAIFDSSRSASDSTSLAHELDPNLMEPRRTKLNGFVRDYQEKADIVLVLHGSTTHDRAVAWYTTDAATPTAAYTFDGNARVHGRLPDTPGSAAIPVTVDQTGLTAIHEFGHAASDWNNGRVYDLYVDNDSGGFDIHKKLRALATDPIPANFATFNANTYSSDQNRDGIGYPNDWVSYHPALVDNTRPNMMDNYWLAFDDPLLCRLDQLTYDWLSERLAAKIFR